MVQIINPSPRAMQAEKIGQALGIGVGKRAGLQEAQNLAESAEGDPVKLAFSLARANMYSPELGRSLGQIYEQLLSRTQSSQLAEGLGSQGAGTQTNPDMQGEVSPDSNIAPSTDTPSNANPAYTQEVDRQPIVYPSKGKYSPEDVDNVSSQYLMDMRPDLVQGSSTYGRVPTFNYQAQSDLRPEEEAQLRQDLINRGVNPKVQQQIVDRTRENIKTKYNEMLTNHNLDQTAQAAINAKWQSFSQAADKNLVPLLGQYSPLLGFGGRPKTAEDLKNKYMQYAGNLPTNLTPEQMHQQASTMMLNDKNRIDALGAGASMPFIREPKDVQKYLDIDKEAYKELAQEGFYESLKEDAAKKDKGLEELHWTIWGDDTSKDSLNRIGNLKAPSPFLKEKPSPLRQSLDIATFGKTRRQEINPSYEKENKKYIQNLSKEMTKIQPKDDLILLRSQALNSGATENDFMKALREAQREGLELSPFQKSQIQELSIPRKRPMWEIFDPSKWSGFINNMRGKR